MTTKEEDAKLQKDLALISLLATAVVAILSEEGQDAYTKLEALAKSIQS
jgi:hypothetical protein